MVGRTPFTLHEFQLATRTTTTVSTTGPATLHVGAASLVSVLSFVSR